MNNQYMIFVAGEVIKNVRPPKIQRLITPRVVGHRIRLKKIKREKRNKSKTDRAEYAKMLSTIVRNKSKNRLSAHRLSDSKQHRTSRSSVDAVDLE